MKDITILSQSKPFIMKPFEEKQVNLSLHKIIHPPQTILYGKVLSEDKPIAGATVKILTMEGNPLFHTFTRQDGSYEFISLIKPGKYKIVATAIGYKLSSVVDIHLVNKLKVHFAIRKDPILRKSTIYGTVKNRSTEEPLYGTKVTLTTQKEFSPIACTMTNSSGQYLIPNVPSGEYILSAKKKGYEPSPNILIPIVEPEFIKTEITLIVNPSFNLGTISGIIEHYSPSHYTFVALYKMDDEEETLVQIKTLNNKMYLFTDVHPGKYIVKAGIENNITYQKEFISH